MMFFNSDMSREELQQITTASPALNEKQKILLSDWSINSDATAETFSLCVTCLADECSGEETYTLSLYGISTGTFTLKDI